MQVVDAAKIEQHREMIDADVVEIVISDGLKRPHAYLKYARTQLDHCLIMRGSDAGWWSCFALSNESVEVARSSHSRHKFESDTKPIEMAEWVIDKLVLGRVPDLVATAVILRILDPHIDVFLDERAFSEYYGRSAWHEIEHAVPFASCEADDTSQLRLFESPDDYQARCEDLKLFDAMRRVARSLTGARCFAAEDLN